jgi:hypothetical protein
MMNETLVALISFVLWSFGVYALTTFITSSELLAPPRKYVVSKTPGLRSPLSYMHKRRGARDDGEPVHPLECRFCTGGWVSLIVAASLMDVALWLPMWGFSYFIVTQER